MPPSLSNICRKWSTPCAKLIIPCNQYFICIRHMTLGSRYFCLANSSASRPAQNHRQCWQLHNGLFGHRQSHGLSAIAELLVNMYNCQFTPSVECGCCRQCRTQCTFTTLLTSLSITFSSCWESMRRRRQPLLTDSTGRMSSSVHFASSPPWWTATSRWWSTHARSPLVLVASCYLSQRCSGSSVCFSDSEQDCSKTCAWIFANFCLVKPCQDTIAY